MGPSSIQTLIRQLWTDLYDIADFYEDDMLKKINTVMQSHGHNGYSTLHDYFADVYTSTDPNTNLFSDNKRERNSAWDDFQKVVSGAYSQEDFINVYRIVDKALFSKRLKQYHNDKSVTGQLKGIINQEIDLTIITAKVNDWAKRHGFAVSIQRLLGDNADLGIDVISQAHNLSFDEKKLPYGDIKSNAEDFTVTGVQPKTAISESYTQEIHNKLLKCAMQGDLPTTEQMQELILFCMISHALEVKKYPYFISIDNARTVTKINLCTNIIRIHLSSTTKHPPGFYLETDMNELDDIIGNLYYGFSQVERYSKADFYYDIPGTDDYGMMIDLSTKESWQEFMNVKNMKADRQAKFRGRGSAWRF